MCVCVCVTRVIVCVCVCVVCVCVSVYVCGVCVFVTVCATVCCLYSVLIILPKYVVQCSFLEFKILCFKGLGKLWCV